MPKFAVKGRMLREYETEIQVEAEEEDEAASIAHEMFENEEQHWLETGNEDFYVDEVRDA